MSDYPFDDLFGPRIDKNHRECCRFSRQAVDAYIEAGKILVEVKLTTDPADWPTVLESLSDDDPFVNTAEKIDMYLHRGWWANQPDDVVNDRLLDMIIEKIEVAKNQPERVDRQD